MINKNSLTIILLIVILAIVAVVLTVIGDFFGEKSEEIKITTEKQEYTILEAIKIKIENNSNKKICLDSSFCYPYYLEYKDENEWKSPSYIECSVDYLIETCIDPKGVKAFEIVPSEPEGIYRLAIPVCNECNIGEAFREDQWFYSDEFIIR